MKRSAVVLTSRFIAGFLGCFAAVLPAMAVEMRSWMEIDPGFAELEETHSVPDGTLELWVTALRDEDTAVQYEACAALTRAHRLHIAVPEAAAEALATIVNRPHGDPALLRAAARTLVVLGARSFAGVLAARLDDADATYRQIVEPALAAWGYAAMANRWRERLRESQGGRQGQLLAIRGLASIKDPAALELLAAIVTGRRDFALRYAAARALAELGDQHVLALAEPLVAGGLSDRRVAAALLSSSDGDRAIELLSQLAVDPDAGVATPALTQLIRTRPAASLAAARQWSSDGNPRLRELAVEALHANPTVDSVDDLVGMLDDVHPMVRGRAADAVVSLAGQPPLSQHIRQQLGRILANRESPRAVVQAALIAGAIDHAAVTAQLLEIVQHGEDDAAIAASWALARLAIPETAEAIVAEIGRRTDHTVAIVAELAPIYASEAEPEGELPDLDDTYRVVEHLLLALGRIGHLDAEPLLSSYVAKPIPQVRGEPPQLETYRQPRLRAAAIWSLGKIAERHSEWTPSKDLVAALTARMTDTTPIPAEAAVVRSMAAVALARMEQRQLLAQFREHYDPDAGPRAVGRACGWAIGQLTGERPRRNLTRKVTHLEWFLLPLN